MRYESIIIIALTGFINILRLITFNGVHKDPTHSVHLKIPSQMSYNQPKNFTLWYLAEITKWNLTIFYFIET